MGKSSDKSKLKKSEQNDTQISVGLERRKDFIVFIEGEIQDIFTKEQSFNDIWSKKVWRFLARVNKILDWGGPCQNA